MFARPGCRTLVLDIVRNVRYTSHVANDARCISHVANDGGAGQIALLTFFVTIVLMGEDIFIDDIEAIVIEAQETALKLAISWSAPGVVTVDGFEVDVWACLQGKGDIWGR